MALFTRSLSEMRDAHRKHRLAVTAMHLGTSDLRGRLEWACAQKDVDEDFLFDLLRLAPKFQDETMHARILRDHATPAELTNELIRDILVKEAFGISGARMLTEAQKSPTVKLYGPVDDGGSAPVLIMVNHTTSAATMVTKQRSEVRTNAAAVIALLFMDWRKDGPRGNGVRSFIQEMGMSAISTLEGAADAMFTNAVAVKDDYDVSSTIEADAVLVFDDAVPPSDATHRAWLYRDATPFRKEKIRFVHKTDFVAGLVLPSRSSLKDRIRDTLLDLEECVCEQAMVQGLLAEPGDPSTAIRTVFITHRDYVPDVPTDAAEEFVLRDS